MTIRSPFHRLHLLSILALGMLSLGLIPAIADAAAVTVTTTADEYGTGSACSLREAIHAANQDIAFGGCAPGSGADTISVPAGSYTLTLAQPDAEPEDEPGEDSVAIGDLDITSSLAITGAGRSATVIESTNKARVFDIHGAGVTATIAQVTVRGMPSPVDREYRHGVRIRPGATLVLTSSAISGSDSAIANEGTIELTDSEAKGGSRYSVGGGIRNTGRASVLRSTVSGSVMVDGGGIANDGEMTLVDSSVSGSAFNGGAVLNTGVLTLQTSTVRGTAMTGGGILNRGTATVTNSTISHSTGVSGGGISNSGTMTVTNSTISNNKASGQGAGITNGGTLSINNSTISANTAEPGDEGDMIGGGLVNRVGTVTMSNTILAGNSAEDPATADCAGTFTSGGYNLVGVTTGCTITGDTTGNRAGVDPKLGPLQDNGGPTWTHALLAGSPALDTGNPGPAGSGGAACEATDQR
ncbi:MAG TPA: right-handed parallel beta-helix repeat-containing protein, partial [Herpetosiphonaceae bacterium]|nr:right-handed parallel beta-helix repeat-containing protein [Herpetosiphonaceae bacterium]